MSEEWPAPPVDPGPPAPQEVAGWQRLAPQMTVVDPLRTLRGFAVPILIAVVGIGSNDMGLSFALLPVMLAGALLVGLLPWLTTRYRVGDAQLQVRRGLVNRTTVTAPLDRVRSVDLEASLLHRVLGLTKVTVGTGVDDTRIELDALATRQAQELQGFLLARRTTLPAAPPGDTGGDPSDPAEAGSPQPDGRPGAARSSHSAVDYRAPAPPPEVLARIDWSWLRFAPFSLARLVLVAGAFGVLTQVVDDLPFVGRRELESARDFVLAQALSLVVVVAVVVALVGWLLVSTLGYVVQWWDLRLVRQDGSLRLTAGLFTTRSTTVEEARVRGVRTSEPVLLRLVGGAELSVLATGVGSGGVTKVLPPSPRAVDVGVGHRVLEDGQDERPLGVPLTSHGAAARRRCHLRALRAVLAPVALVIGAAVWADVAWWLPAVVVVLLLAAAVVRGELAWRHLGHALTADHLVAGSPTAARVRTVLETDGVIGWNLSESWFQRRAGLVTLTATTAAGPERVTLVDLPRRTALTLADRATPGMLTEFLAPPTAPSPTA